FGNSVIFSGNLTGLSTADPDVVQFFGGGANISGVGGGLATGAKFANFSDANQFVIMTLAQHNGFTQPFQQTLLTQQITLVDSGVATGDAGIEQYNLANGNDTFTVAKDNGAFKQNINVASGGDDTLVFDTGTFSGTYTGDSFNDTIKFVGNADISGAVGLGPIGNVDFSNANVSVTVNFLNQYQFFTQPFLNTANVQTITFSVGLTLPTGDVGIENYVFSTADDQFIVAADNNQLVGGAQNTDFSSGGNDLIAYYTGKYSGNVVGMGAGDRVVFANGVMDISGVNGGAATGATFVLFNLSAIAATMTMAQYNGFTQPFSLTSGSTQTVILTTSGVATGDAGIENYKLASGDDTFTVAKDNIGLIDGKQNVDIGSGGNDVIHYGAGTFTGNLVGGGVGDTVQFDGDVTDVSGVNGGAVMGPKTVSFSNTAVDVSMTLVQHNDFTKPFGSTTGTQTITFTTNGTATGDIGIEQYILGQDGKGPNFFTVGIIGQSVTGRNDNDTVINPFGGVSGVLLGGSNTPTGDTLILQGANTTLAAGSGQFENLTLTVNNGTVTSNTFAHNGFTGVIDAPGTNNTYTVNDNLGGVLTGLSGFENYTFASNGGGFDFTLTDAQTGTITGSTRNDIFRATAGQIAEAILIDAGSAPFEILHINTDAAGLDLAAKTAGFDRFFLNAGSTANVFGVNSSNVLYAATGSTIFTMGSVGANQTYNGGTGANAGIDNVTFNVGSTSVFTNEGNDIVTSLVGGALTGTLNGGADFDKLSLTNNDDLTGATVTSFEDLLLANNASVKMTGTQYNQFTTNSQALGTNAVTVVTAGGGILGSRDLFAGIENWTLLDGLQSVYTITGDGQSVTDQRSGNVANQATIDGGLTGVTLLANGGAGYVVIDASGGTNHSITLVGGGGNADSVIFGGVHTGIALDAGLENDFIQVQTAGNISGTLNGGGGTSDSLNLFDAADISGSTVSGFENLLLVSNAAAKMSGATWDQFVGTNGTATAGHSVEGLGDEAVTLSSTTNNVTTAYTDTDRIENYVLSSNANDFFRVNNTSTAPADQVEVNLSGGGTDFIVLNDGSGAALNSQDVRTTLVNFASGVGGDVVQVQLNGASISSGGAVVTAAVDQNIAAATTTVVYNSNLALMDGTWSAVEARAALDAALGAGTVADEQLLTMTVYNTDGGAYVMAVQVKDADTFSTANMDLIGVLNTVGVNTLVTTNFT
ncbi:MAG: beta strand repeat-containing protein, partial [Reyranella sp.]